MPRHQLIALDTQILIYAHRDSTVGTKEEMANTSAAKQIIKHLKREEYRLCLAADTLGEFLAGFPESLHAGLLNNLDKDFELAIYNKRAAQINGARWQKSKCRRQGDRIVFTADMKILASLLAYGCRKLITNDKQLKALAPEFGIDTSPLAHQTEFDFFN